MKDTATFADYHPRARHRLRSVSVTSFSPFELDGFADTHERRLVTDLVPPADLAAYATAADIKRRIQAYWVLRKRRNEKEARTRPQAPPEIDAIWHHALVVCDKLSDAIDDLSEEISGYLGYMKILTLVKDRLAHVRGELRVSKSLPLDLAQLLAGFERDLLELPKLAATSIATQGYAGVRLQATEGGFTEGTLKHLLTEGDPFDGSDPIEYIVNEVKYMASPKTAIRVSDDTYWLLPHTASHITYWSNQ